MKASDLLAEWGCESERDEILRSDCDNLEEMSIEDARRYVDIKGEFGATCSVILDVAKCKSDDRTRLGPFGLGRR